MCLLPKAYSWSPVITNVGFVIGSISDIGVEVVGVSGMYLELRFSEALYKA